MSDKATAASGGLSFIGALTLLFIGLKLGGVIDWSWLWVLSPIWIQIVIVVLLAFVIACLEVRKR